MSEEETEFRPDDGIVGPKTLGEGDPKTRKQYTLCLAHALFLGSYGRDDRGQMTVYPEGDPARCFTLAEEFVAEAVRRGY